MARLSEGRVYMGSVPNYAPHLSRLGRVWVCDPVYFITTCTANRRPILANPTVADRLRDEWWTAESRHGWRIGRYIIMPDHVHFFAAPVGATKTLGEFVGRWKEWTAKSFLRHGGNERPIWQHRFFDHVLRSRKSYEEKWEYVRQNPVRAGLVADADDWIYAGYIHFDEPM